MTDIEYMRRAISLAKKGMGYTNPNPMVGAVIVKDGRIIGEGYHHKCGDLHAERDAFKNLTESAEGATIYVTLEPCCHHGKQPPCTEAIVEHGIKRVVIGSRDPNPLVSGKGSTFLRSKGIIVEEDLIREECDEINPAFFHYIRTKTPYVVMKYAMTLDGKIATYTGASKWITGETAREHVHTRRAYYAAIMAGIGTVLADNPMLNARIEGQNPHQPLRVIVDSNLRIPVDSAIVQTAKDYPTVIAHTETADAKRAEQLKACGLQLWVCGTGPHVDLKQLIVRLGEEGIDSVLVEGGGILHEAMLKEGLVNHVMAYVAPKIFGGMNAKTPVEGLGVQSPSESPKLVFRQMTSLGEDLLLEYDLEEK